MAFETTVPAFLTKSTLINASTRADPFAVVLAGLGAVSGPLHGRASLFVQRLLADAEQTSAEAACARVLSAGECLAGFGHLVYPDSDPRASCLLSRLCAYLPARRWVRIERLIALGREATGRKETVDFALGVLSQELKMIPGGSEAVFAFARIAGWIAHALEEYQEKPLRFRAHSVYLGPVLGPNA